MEIRINIKSVKRGLENIAYMLFCICTLGLIAVLRIAITKGILKAEELK